ncbi:MAG: N-acetyltransferase family protein [Deltaproteobacteria bacterium]
MTIRIATLEDAAAIRAIYAPHVATLTSFEQSVPSIEEMQRRLAATLERTPWLVLDEGEVVGYAYAGPYRSRHAYQWSVEASVYVAAPHQRRGIARRLYAALFAALELQGFVNVYAGITLPNDASEAFHRALGFEPIGVYRGVGYKHGGWRDVAWSAKRLATPDGEPSPPRLLPEARQAIAICVAAF